MKDGSKINYKGGGGTRAKDRDGENATKISPPKLGLWMTWSYEAGIWWRR